MRSSPALLLLSIAVLLAIVSFCLVNRQSQLSSEDLGAAKEKVLAWRDKPPPELSGSQSRGTIVGWALRHRYWIQFTDPGKKHLLVFMDSVQDAGILCPKRSIVSQIVFDENAMSSVIYFTAIKQCMGHLNDDHLFDDPRFKLPASSL